MAWVRMPDAQAYSRLSSGEPSRLGFNYDPGKENSNPGAPSPKFMPDLKGANQAQQGWRGDPVDPMMNQPASINNFGWMGGNPAGYNGQAWDTTTPSWAQNAWEYGRAQTLPDQVRNTSKYDPNGGTKAVPGFTPPPQGWDGPSVNRNHLVFGRGPNNWLNGSGVTLPQGDWDTASVDFSRPNWWNPQSGSWKFGKQEKDNGMGGLGMLSSLGGALMGFGFSPPVLSMIGGGGGGVSNLNATYNPPTAQNQQVNQQANPQQSGNSRQSVIDSMVNNARSHNNNVMSGLQNRGQQFPLANPPQWRNRGLIG